MRTKRPPVTPTAPTAHQGATREEIALVAFHALLAAPIEASMKEFAERAFRCADAFIAERDRQS